MTCNQLVVGSIPTRRA